MHKTMIRALALLSKRKCFIFPIGNCGPIGVFPVRTETASIASSASMSDPLTLQRVDPLQVVSQARSGCCASIAGCCSVDYQVVSLLVKVKQAAAGVLVCIPSAHPNEKTKRLPLQIQLPARPSCRIPSSRPSPPGHRFCRPNT